MTTSPQFVNKSITAQNIFTDPLSISSGGRASISNIAGTSTTTTLQRRFHEAEVMSAWFDVESWSVDTETSYVADETQEIRLGVKTGDYGSGTTTVRLGIG